MVCPSAWWCCDASSVPCFCSLYLKSGSWGFGLFFAGPSLSQKYTVEAGNRSHWQDPGHKVEKVGWNPTVRTLPGWGIEGGSWENRQGVVNTPRERERGPDQSRSVGGTRLKEVCSSAPGTQIPCCLVTSSNWNDEWLLSGRLCWSPLAIRYPF